jgi:hypothetical protein
MADNNFLNLKVGSPKRKVKVTDVRKETVTIKDGTSEKIQFIVHDNGSNRDFQISDAWIEDYKGTKKVQGLWFTLSHDGSELSSGSSVAKLLRHYGATSLQELIGTDIYVYPDPNDFLVIVACDLDDAPKQTLFQ